MLLHAMKQYQAATWVTCSYFTENILYLREFFQKNSIDDLIYKTVVIKR